LLVKAIRVRQLTDFVVSKRCVVIDRAQLGIVLHIDNVISLIVYSHASLLGLMKVSLAGVHPNEHTQDHYRQFFSKCPLFFL
jgi:hypothetical protein